MPIRIVLADDHPIVLHGLQQLFDGEPDFTVVDCCREGESALAAVRSTPVDILVLDLRMPGRTGLDVMRAIAAERLECKTVLLTAALNDDDAVEAMRLGARGVVLKESSPETLLECIRKVHRGEQWVDQETMSAVLERVSQRAEAARVVAKFLTPREVEIVRM